MGILEEIRKELHPLNVRILNSPFLSKAREGKLDLELVRKFVINQWYIVNHDLRSLSIGLARSEKLEELVLFKNLVDGDYEALKELVKLMGELKLPVKDPLTYEVSPKAVEYTHFLSWLANYARPSEFLLIISLNLPVWGEAVGGLGKSLKEKYGVKETGFFELFSSPNSDLENGVERLIGVVTERLRNMAFMIQRYELDFWESLTEV
ncbi:MAG: TenA family transcriptional regulator [Metallosphaera yellowstonensis]|jgi:Putative transcription activator